MNENLQLLIKEYKEKFGIELNASQLYEKGKWAFICTPAAQAYGKGELVGLKVAKLDGYYKMSTAVCQLLAKSATSRVIELNREQAEQVITGKSIRVENTVNGFCIIKYGKFPVAVGHVKDGVLEPQIGKDILIRAVDSNI